jgi:hypothetical protein
VSRKLLDLVTHRTSGGCLYEVSLELDLEMFADGIGEHPDRLRHGRRFVLGSACRLWFDDFTRSRLLAHCLPSAHDSLVLGLVFMQSRDGGLYGRRKKLGGSASAGERTIQCFDQGLGFGALEFEAFRFDAELEVVFGSPREL